MLFNSYAFIFAFLPTVFFLYFILNNGEAKKLILIASSLFFYGWWNVSYLPIILTSIIANYIIGRSITSTEKSKYILILGIASNLSLLGYFKYFDFLIDNANLLLDIESEPLNILLPLAISFFTFQQIAYLVDCHRDKSTSYSLTDYFLFVTFFPQLIAGPIVHHKEMMPQFMDKNNWKTNYSNIYKGIFIFSIGLFKKVIIADTFASWATAGFDHAEKLSLIDAWATSLSYTFQLYFDFSGYADMAIGLALLFNIKLPTNFNSPYKARNIQEFWRRWHITLSRFLRDYIYIPLGGSKKGSYSTSTNLMTTFLLGGIWHGAGWTFIFWGFLHGMALIIQRAWTKTGIRLPIIISWFITFNFINIAWIFFRAENWTSATKVLSAMFSFDYIVLPSFLSKHIPSNLPLNIEFGGFLKNINGDFSTLPLLLLALAITLVFKNSSEFNKAKVLTSRNAIFSSLLFTLSIMSLNKASEFLYFNF